MARKSRTKKIFVGTFREYFDVNGETFLLTAHAIDQAFERTGCTSHDIRKIVKKAYKENNIYRPGENARYEQAVDEFWVKLEGPKGKGTIVVSRFSGHNASLETDWTITTVRDANGFTQSERSDERLTYRPFAQLMQTGS